MAVYGNADELDEIEKFVDGASVQRVGDLTFSICQKNLDVMTTVHEGKICQTILDMYNKDAIVAEPAGVMSIAALDEFKDEIKVSEWTQEYMNRFIDDFEQNKRRKIKKRKA